MAQPVRKTIKEAHPEISDKKIYTLLVDGTNLLTISFADTKFNSNGVHYGGVFQFLLQLKLMLKKKDFDYVYVVFDDEASGVMRYKYYKLYKANREKEYFKYDDGLSEYMQNYNKSLRDMQRAIFSKNKNRNDYYKDGHINTQSKDFIDENFVRERTILMKYFEEMYIRCIFDDKTEGDDIIAYYVNNKKENENVVIMSTDRDLTQLLSKSVCIWDARQKKFVTYDNFKSDNGYPSENVVIKKIFCGDSSDNIGNIRGLSEAGLMKLMPEMKDRPISVDEVKKRAQDLIEERVKNKKKPLQVHQNIVNGISNKEYDGDYYEVNDKIINLKNPLLTDDAKETVDAMRYATQDPEGRSFGNLYSYIIEDNIEDLKDTNRFSSFFAEFKGLANREEEKFKKNIE